MTDSEFAERLTNMRETIYRISCSQLYNPSDRDDAVQETLLKAWYKRHRLENEQYMKTWVIRILINECHNIHRKQKREAMTYELPEQMASVNNNVELYDALLRLNEKLRLPVVLHYIEGYKVQEISKILNVPKGTVLWRMSKAREELSVILESEEQSNKDKTSSRLERKEYV
jgi:RNA polymerase sigma-70 factor (ECF subfamily)